MSALLELLDVTAGPADTWQGRGSGPAGKRAYGGQLVAQALASGSRTVALRFSLNHSMSVTQSVTSLL